MFGITIPAWGWAAVVTLILGSYTATYIKGHVDGSDSKQAEWTASINADVANANKDRGSVDSSIPLNPSAGELCNDKWNRDKC